MRMQRIAITAMIAALASPAMVKAQAANDTQAAAPKPETSAAPGDIIVTANRTQSLASKTPVALTAISGDALAKSGVTATSKLADHVPNLVLAMSNGGLQITIRGVTNEEATARGDPSAAFLIDNVYIARPQAVDVSMFDISRVEVLRGPQGTLFGRNTTAGLVHIITNRPIFENSGKLDFTLGNYGTYQLTGVINSKLSDHAAVRAAFNYDQRDNYINSGPQLTSNITPYRKNISGRFSGLYTWNSGEIVLRADYSDIGGHMYDILPLYNFYSPASTGVDPNFIGGTTKQRLSSNAPITWDVFRKNYTYGLGGEIKQNLGPIDAFYVGSYRQFHRNESDPKISADAASAYRLEWYGDINQQSHELRFATANVARLKAQVGTYYFLENITQQFRLNLVANQPFFGNVNRTGDAPLVNTSYGFFGQATYSVLDDLRLTAGVRYSNDNKKSLNGFTDLCSQFDCSTAVTRTSTNAANASFSKVTWRAGVDYDVNSTTMAFANISTGYKAGGFNTGCELGTQPGCTLSRDALYFRPETVTSYEGGIKGSLLDRKLRYSLVGFHYDYTNIQLNQLINDCGGGASCSATTNGGRAKINGLELEGSFNITPNDRFALAGTWLDAKFTEFSPVPGVSLAGRPLSKSPRWTLSPGYTHTFELDGGANVEISAHSRISAEYYFLSIGTRNYYRQPGFSKTDATISYNAPQGQWYVQGFIQNIENAVPITTVIIGARSAVLTEAPRTFGLRGGLKF